MLDLESPEIRQALESRDKAIAYRRGGIFAMAGLDSDNLAVQGFATRYHEPCLHNGEVIAFAEGAFRDARPSEVDVRCEHNPEHSFNLGGLELADSKYGVAFRVPIPRNLQGYALQGMVRSFSKADVSTGCQFLASEMMTIQGVDVRIVTKAKLVEISLVEEGAMPYAIANVVDVSKEPPLLEIASSGVLALDCSCQAALSSLKKLRRQIGEEEAQD